VSDYLILIVCHPDIQLLQFVECRSVQAVSVLWNCLAYFNSCVNPIIYNRTSKEFRDAFLEACGCRRARDRCNSADAAKVPDERRVSMVARLTPDGRRHTSCTPVQSPSMSPSPDTVQKSASALEHLSATSRPAATASSKQEVLCHSRSTNMLVVPSSDPLN